MIADHDDEDAIARLEQHLALLRRCHQVGIEQAFAERTDTTGTSPDVPSQFRDDLHRAQMEFQRYLQTGNLPALNEAVDAWERILNHPAFSQTERRFRLAAWNDAGGAYLRCYEAMGDLRDLDTAMNLWNQAIARMPEGSPDWAMYQANLGVALWRRFHALGQVEDLNNAIAALKAALEVVREGSPDWARWQANLGVVLSTRFEALGQMADLDEAIAAYEKALAAKTTREGSPDWARWQGNLGNALSMRFEARGHVVDLDASIAAYQTALEVAREGSPNWAMYQANLGVALRTRFEARGHVVDLDASIAAVEAALTVAREGSPDWARWQANLGGALLRRFGARGYVADLDASIAAVEAALTVVQEDSPNWSMYQANLGVALRTRFGALGQMEDLDEAIAATKAALEVVREGSPNWARWQTNLGVALRTRFGALGQMEDLDEASAATKAALGVVREGSPNWARWQAKLGVALRMRFEALGQVEDLEAAIAAIEMTLSVLRKGSSDWATYQANLGGALLRRFEALGEVEDLDATIDAVGAALDADTTREGSPDWARWQGNLGGALLRRFKAGGRVEDLDVAIAAFEAALDADTTREGSPDWARWQNNLGLALRTRFEVLRQMANLDKAIVAYGNALSVTREGSPDWASMQNNLSLALRMRFEALRQAEDLDAAIAAIETALSVAQEESLDWASMQANLARALLRRFEALRQVADLDEAIAACHKALDAAREGFPHWARWQASLGNALCMRFETLGQAEDLEGAIVAYHQALNANATRKGSPDWARWQGNLGNALRTRGDTDGAIEAYREALEVFTPETYPDYTLTAALPLGRLLMGRSQDEDLDDAARVYRAARSAADYLYFESLHQSRRERELRRARGVAANQAYALAHEGDHREAVAALEAGRARALAESLLGQRALETVAAPAEKKAMEAAWRNVQQAQSVYNQADEEEPRRRAERQLAQARRAYYDQMREAFPDYFEPPTFDRVQAAAADAPLVYLAATPAGGLALVVTPSQSSSESDVHPLWLDDLSEETLRERLVGPADDPELGGYLGAYNDWRRNPRDGAARAAWLEAIDETTRWLWDAAMEPIVEEVAVGDASHRATLIPAGLLGLLPLHAAWTEDPAQSTNRRYALDEINLTYTPNARALDAARERAAGRDAEGLLAVDEPQPVSASPLPSSSWETAAACDHFSNDETYLLGGEAATKEGVLEAMPRYAVLHLSCHGFANPAEPLESGLLMAHDELLSLRDVQALRLERARLAVLSACETRLPGIDVIDEVIALPTGLVQAGVPGVVGSLWSVLDLSTAMLMVRFYDLWRGDDLSPAEALRQAQIWLRDTTNAQKADYFGTELPELSAARMPVPLADMLFKEAALKNPEERAFAHPFHWAAFAFTGV